MTTAGIARFVILLAATPRPATNPSVARCRTRHHTPRSAPAGPATVGRQESLVDAGSFTIFRGSTKVGREEFAIRRASPPDGGFLASGTVIYADRRLIPVLGTDSSGAPERYQVDVRLGDRRAEMVSVLIGHGQGSTRTQTARGESATEFEVPPGARLLDDNVFSHYFFFARTLLADPPGPLGRGGVTVPVIIPRRTASVPMRAVIIGPDSVEIAGRRVAATRFRLTAAAGDDRDVWADAAGRVLRVAVPSLGLVATRDDVPR